MLKLGNNGFRAERYPPAAFRRLCVETPRLRFMVSRTNQPPSGGCVLKLYPDSLIPTMVRQPPSGGCVLKLLCCQVFFRIKPPAAFRRLCVETMPECFVRLVGRPAAFRRLCVETSRSDLA